MEHLVLKSNAKSYSPRWMKRVHGKADGGAT
jgi:hypothetical protein